MSRRRPGYALATILVLMGVMLFGIGGIISISVLESKISRSQQEGSRAYYVAEAGAQDALWRLNNNTTYFDALAAGTLNTSYTVTDKPQIGQGFTVTLLSTSAHYGTVTVVGYSDNGNFRAQRKIITNMFQGPPDSPTGANAVMSGGGITITNGSSTLEISGGDFYSTGAIKITSAAVNLGSNKILTPADYTANNATVTSGGIQSSNNLPAADTLSIPGIDFTYYAANADTTYSPAQFQSFVSAAGATVTIPGPITYISADLSIGNWAKNKTLNITGLLVINGSLSVTSAAQDLVVNVLDPGDGKSGILMKTGHSNNIGTWSIDGILYTSGSMQFLNSGSITVNGAIVAGGSIQMNTGTQFSLTYDSARAGATFGAGAPLTVGVQHWEEEY